MAATVEVKADCWLCRRQLGKRIEWHHPVPKSRGGKAKVPLHPICHRTIHAVLSNREIEHAFADATALRGHPDIARFISWVEDKDPDFHAPTHRRR